MSKYFSGYKNEDVYIWSKDDRCIAKLEEFSYKTHRQASPVYSIGRHEPVIDTGFQSLSGMFVVSEIYDTCPNIFDIKTVLTNEKNEIRTLEIKDAYIAEIHEDESVTYIATSFSIT